MNSELWLIIVAFLVAANCGLIGCFLVLRKQAMIGDALSHAILPGIVCGFLLTNSTHPIIFVCGATVAGVLATLLIELLVHHLRIASEVAIGITFTAFFSLGIILITVYTQKADLDQGCVLYGQLITISFDTWRWGGYDLGPKIFWFFLALSCANGLFIGSCYRPLFLTSFDPDMANAIGVRTKRWHYILMLFTAVTTVLSFRAVGAPLVIAFLVIPPSIAYLLSHRLSFMLLYTMLVCAIIALDGYQLAVGLNVSLPGAMATVGGGLFAVTFGLTRKAAERKS